MPQPMENMPASNQLCMARALYDNIPDSPDELAFRKGDTLTVLEQNTANIEGWWLCSLRGRQGICPANRLRLIPGSYEDSGGGGGGDGCGGGGQTRVCSPQFTEIAGDFNSLQRQGKRRSWHVQPNQVVTPKKFNDVYLYDMPPSRCSPIPVPGLSPNQQSNDCYDVPPRAVPVSGGDSYRNCPRCSPAPSCISPISSRGDPGEAYDIPRSLQGQQNQLTPSSSASSLTADSLSSSNRSSLVNMPDYDVPRPHNRGPQLVLHTTSHYHQQLQLQQQQQQTYDIPTSQPLKELPLELNSALENLERLQTDTTSSISKLLGFVGPQWRTKEKLENNLMEIKFAITRLRTSLHDLAEFGEGALGNAARASDKNLAIKLSPLVMALKKSDCLVQNATDKLNNEHNWSIELLAINDDGKSHKPDELEQLVACSRALTEDIRQIASFIQGNGLLLFKKEPPLTTNATTINTTTTTTTPSTSEWMEDYDYVRLDSKEAVIKKHAEIRDALPKELQTGYDKLIKNIDELALIDSDNNNKLDTDDKQLLKFFAKQIITHHKYLTHAIDAFLQTVEHNQPPKIFLAHGKFVVLSAHKLINIGDTVHRNIYCKTIKERSLQYANALSDALANSVNKTKQAALQFPSVNAVQEMVDSIVDISYSARDLKVCLVQSACPL